MTMLLTLLLAGLLQAPPAPETPPPPAPMSAPPAPAAPKPAVVHVLLTTSAGPIALELEKQRAPITTANFLKYVDQKRLDGMTIYRAVNVAPGFGLIQGGVTHAGPKRLLPPIAHEPTSKTGLSHTDGAISMPRGKLGTASGDFFITVGDLTSMNADPAKTDDAGQGFAVFGHVTEGMDVVRKVLAAPTSATTGPAAMKGEMLAVPVRILTARRVP